MGLFTAIIAYRSGKRRARRHAQDEYDDLADEAEEECDHCGYRREQHHDDGRCPTY